MQSSLDFRSDDTDIALWWYRATACHSGLVSGPVLRQYKSWRDSNVTGDSTYATRPCKRPFFSAIPSSGSTMTSEVFAKGIEEMSSSCRLLHSTNYHVMSSLSWNFADNNRRIVIGTWDFCGQNLRDFLSVPSSHRPRGLWTSILQLPLNSIYNSIIETLYYPVKNSRAALARIRRLSSDKSVNNL